MLPHAEKWDEEEIFPVETLRKLAELGFAGIYIKDDIGGSGLSRLDAAIVFEVAISLRLFMNGGCCSHVTVVPCRHSPRLARRPRPICPFTTCAHG